MIFQSDLIDVRPESEFFCGHTPGAVGIPLEELSRRAHELPPPGEPLRLVDSHDQRGQSAAFFLRQRGHLIDIIRFDALEMTERGPAQARLWRPNPFLEESLEAIESEQSAGARSGQKRALDVACGSGRDSVHLALAGYRVQAIDILPDALRRAGDLARRSGVQIELACQDLEQNPTLPTGFDVVIVFRYLHRPLVSAIKEAVKPGGHLVYETFHEQTRSTGHPPTSPNHLLRDRELQELFGDFDIRIAQDRVERDGRFFSNLLARRR